ncbi:MAG TPA: acyl-CoA desaturase [Acidimicrobiales bacterium]
MTTSTVPAATTRARAVAPPVPTIGARIGAAADATTFVGVHLACLAVPAVGVTPRALAVAAAGYALRCFGVTAGFHRYFSHRSFRAGRGVQCTLALLGTLAMQRGVLWWAATHRRHHAVADTPADVHSPHHRSFLYSHCGWFLDPANQPVEHRRVRDLTRYPELVLLDRAKVAPIALFGAGLWWLGPDVFVWAFCVATVALWHATLATGSFSHRVGGYRNFPTPDDSRNNRLIALVLLGEGWHNNHHHSPRSACHGVRRSELDPIGATLRLLARLGLVRDLLPPPAALPSVPAYGCDGAGGAPGTSKSRSSA